MRHAENMRYPHLLHQLLTAFEAKGVVQQVAQQAAVLLQRRQADVLSEMQVMQVVALA